MVAIVPLSRYLNGFGLLARDDPRDRLARVLSGLQRDRPELGEQLLLTGIRDRGDVSDDVDLGVIGERELRPHGDAVALLELDPERPYESIRLQAGTPDQRVRLEHGARLERDARRGDRLDDLARHHLDRALLQGLLRVGAEVRLEHGEHLGARLDEGDAGQFLRHVRIVLREVGAVELCQRARRLDARRPAADDDDVQRAVLGERRIFVCRFPLLQHVLLQTHGVGKRVHREGVLGGSSVPKKLTSAPSARTR